MMPSILSDMQLPNVLAASMAYLAVQMASGHAVDNKHATSMMCAQKAAADSVLSSSPLRSQSCFKRSKT